MSENCLYNNFIDSKSGIKIPVFVSGRTVDSRYDPLRECQRIISQIEPGTKFFVITGIASGTLIKAINEAIPDSFIIAIEKSQSEIDFLLQLEQVKKLKQNLNIQFCTVEELEQTIINFYLPAFYGNFKIIEQPGWITENKDLMPQINSFITNALNKVSADFSVQSHFGKLWQHNILNNLFFIDSSKEQKFPLNKTAIIFAAGPSLDNYIKTLISEKKHTQDNYYLIATDTAFSTLLSNGLIPDAVVSIDGQYVSNTHFIHEKQFDFSKTNFLFDLSANSSAVKKIAKEQFNIQFFKSGHPFCEYTDEYFGLNLPTLFSGAGTVTICAVDYAHKIGFKNLIVAGADFSYINGKPYAKGTYLDKLYNSSSSRFESSQKKFCALEFRTPLVQIDSRKFTTQVLQNYRTSFEDYLQINNLKFEKKDELYYINNSNENKNQINNNDCKIDKEKIETFLNSFKSIQKNEIFNINNLSKKDISLLPLISWLRTHDNNNKADFIYFFNKAVQYFNKWENI